jgi:co-chaperonin GroES (HSP10)
MIFKPMPGRIYAILDAVEEKKIGSIIIADKTGAQSRIGTVKAIGKDVEDLKVGDRILVSYATGVVIDLPELYRHCGEKGGGQDIHRIYCPQEILTTVEGEEK